MLHYLLNWVFASYTDSLYAAASRIHNKGSIYYKDKVQDLVVLAFEEYDRKIDQGIILNLPLLLNFIRYRKPEVLLDMRGYSRSHKKDVFNVRNRVEGKLVLLPIDADHQPAPADVLEELEPGNHGAQAFPDPVAHPLRVRDELLPVQHVQRRQSGDHREAALAERGAMHHRALHAGKNLLMNPLLAQHGAHGHEAAGKGLGQHHDVRVHVTVMLDCQKSSRAPHARLHLVGNENGPVLAAKPGGLAQVAR